MDKNSNKPTGPLPWFRYYNGALNSPRVQALDPFYFKAWVNLLCVTSLCDGRIVTSDVPFRLRVTTDQAEEVLHMLEAADLLVNYGDHYIPKDWDIRQYKSDTSAGRTRDYRERKKAAKGDVTVTPKVTAPDTEQIQSRNRTDKKDLPASPSWEEVSFTVFWECYPKQRAGAKDKALKAWLKALTRAAEHEILEGVRAYATSDEVARGFAKGAAAWLNDDRWTTDYNAKPAGKPDYFEDMLDAGRQVNQKLKEGV